MSPGAKLVRKPRSILHHAVMAGLFAILAFLPIHFLRYTPLVGGASDAALDFVMRMQADRGARSTGPGVTVVDIGDAEYAALDRPTVLPRDKLGTMLERIAAFGPKLIILDVDVSWPDSAEHPGVPSKGEEGLRTVLGKLARGRGGPILLVREALFNEIGKPAYLRPSPYDSVVDAKGRVQYVSAAIINPDGVTRRLQPWYPFCRGATATVLPGVQLAAKVALSGSDPAAAFRRLQDQLVPARVSCRPNDGLRNRTPDSLNLLTGRTAREWRTGDSADRILYRFGWNTGRMLSAAMSVIPAQPLLDHRGTTSPDFFRNRIVIIGTSASAERDILRTPLGRMPGVFVIANAVRGTLAEGPSDEEGLVVGLMVALAMSAVTFSVWLLLRRYLDFNVVLLREGLKIGLTGVWGVVAWFCLSHGGVIDFAFPQYIVISYLAYTEGLDSVI